MHLSEVMILSGCVGVAAQVPLIQQFFGSPEAALLSSPNNCVQDLAAKKLAARGRRVSARRGAIKPRRGVCLLDGTRMQQGWIVLQVLRSLSAAPTISRDLAQKLKIAPQHIECCMSYLLAKMQVSWRPSNLRYKPRMWSITQSGRDALELMQS